MQSRDRYTYVVAARLQHELSRRDCEVIGVSTPASAFCCPASKKKPFSFLLVSYCTTDRLPSETRRSIKTLLFLPFLLCLGGQVGLFFSSFSGGFWTVCCYGFIYMARAVSRESAGLHQLPSLTYNPSSGGTWLLKQKHHDDGWRLM